MDNSDSLLKTQAKMDDVTPEKCIETCANMSSVFAGVETGSECFCGDTVPTEDMIAKDEECDSPCQGDKKKMCGGTSRMNIYTTSNNTH